MAHRVDYGTFTDPKARVPVTGTLGGLWPREGGPGIDKPLKIMAAWRCRVGQGASATPLPQGPVEVLP